MIWDWSESWVSRNQAAESLGVSCQRVDQLVRNGTFDAIKTTFGLIIPREQVEARREAIRAAFLGRRVLCKVGHELTPETAYRGLARNGREYFRCKQCANDYQARYRREHPEFAERMRAKSLEAAKRRREAS